MCFARYLDIELAHVGDELHVALALGDLAGLGPLGELLLRT